ncbi:hypothetical protein MRB53_007980 [Persea americana]|uniref:Uncharacterized protein n=1 Tax=Persea americana TaxID=3435 RepID=A0ACC2MM43_PERAE|nr:hypothetical protein MRB53_007980 [Persea americana]
MKRRTRPNKLTLPFLLEACSQLLDLRRGKQIQANVVKNGVDSDIYIHNTLIRFYGSCKEISDACWVFDGMCFKTVVSWNSIISGAWKSKCGEVGSFSSDSNRSCCESSTRIKIWERGVVEKLEETPSSQERAFCREMLGADDTRSW